MIENKTNFKRQKPPAQYKTIGGGFLAKCNNGTTLTINEEKFIRCLCAMPEEKAFFNASEAARQAYPNHRYPGVWAVQLLRKEKIKNAIKEYRKRLMHEFDITPKRILSELAALAFSNMSDFYNDDGTLKNVSDLPRAISASLNGIEAQIGLNEMGQPAVTQKIKIHDKKSALETLGKYHGMWTDKFELNVGDNQIQGDERARQMREKLLTELSPIETDGE